MKEELLSWLRSPADGSKYRLEGEVRNDDEIVSGVLSDDAGSHIEIVDGVPCFAPELADDPTFGFKWRRIGDSYGHAEPSRSTRRRWYLDRFGFPDEGILHSFLAAGGTVLDAGCGSGVDTSLFSESGATVIAVDLSRDAASATYRRVGQRANVHVLQADVRHLPFAPASFGYVSSDQVLHHTPDTGAAFAAVGALVAPGGSLAVYVYNRKAPLREFADDFIRERTTAMGNEECWEFSRQITTLGRELSRTGARITLPGAIELLGFAAGEHDVQRFVYWNVLKCFWNEEYDFDLNVAVNFDWYHPRWAHRHTPDEVTGWYERAGVAVERLHELESGIAALGFRALAEALDQSQRGLPPADLRRRRRHLERIRVVSPTMSPALVGRGIVTVAAHSPQPHPTSERVQSTSRSAAPATLHEQGRHRAQGPLECTYGIVTKIGLIRIPGSPWM